MTKAAKLQNQFHRSLSQYINDVALNRIDLVTSLISPKIPCTYRSGQIIQEFTEFQQAVPPCSETPIEICVSSYMSKNQYVLRMMDELVPLKEYFFGAYVHGSLGTYEEINYSDFDALIIIRNEVFNNKTQLASLAHKLCQLQRVMLEFDPLQHHGWFVLTETDLQFYCEASFPTELYKYAKSILPGAANTIVIYPRDSVLDLEVSFINLSNAILGKINNQKLSLNMYELKCLLSQIMLLPSLYLQVKLGKGVFKKQSFQLARRDFEDNCWDVMNEISSIRKDWEYRPGFLEKQVPYCPFVWARFMRKKFASKVPETLNNQLTPNFYSKIDRLVRQMQVRLSNSSAEN